MVIKNEIDINPKNMPVKKLLLLSCANIWPNPDNDKIIMRVKKIKLIKSIMNILIVYLEY